MLRLPKDILNHPHLARLEAHFTATERPLRPDGPIIVSFWPVAVPLAKALHAVLGSGHLIQGLELIGETLAKEQKGLRLVQAKSGQVQVERLSRLLFLSNDGSERFVRDVEGVLAKHGERVWGCCLDASAAELGAAFTAKRQPAKALMIDDRKAVGLFLSVLADAL